MTAVVVLFPVFVTAVILGSFILSVNLIFEYFRIVVFLHNSSRYFTISFLSMLFFFFLFFFLNGHL